MTNRTIIPENIQTLGPLYQAGLLEQMKAYDVADRLLELHQRGLLPVGRTGGGHALARHWKQSSGAVSKTQRARAYTQAFGFPGGTEAGVKPNREFNDLWTRFVSSVSTYTRQVTADATATNARAVSHEDVRNGARDLAANLSRHGFGMAHVPAMELPRQINSLIEVLSDPEIQRAYGVRGVARLVERVSALELGGAARRADYLAKGKSGAIILAWLAKRSEALPSSADVLNLAEIKGRRRDHDPTTNPTDYDLVDACEQWLAVTGVPDSDVDPLSLPRESPEARDAVRHVFSKSAAFAQLSSAMRSRISRDTASIVDNLIEGHTEHIRRIDFPKFVADLIAGVFNAIVDSSIEQMEAYADMAAAVAATIDLFRDEHVNKESMREQLCTVSPLLCDPPTHEERQRVAKALDALAGGTWRRMAKSRQQLLATMVMLGVNRSLVRIAHRER